MIWHEERLCVFDTETTGVDLDESRIVSAAVIFCGGGLDTERVTWLANPGIEIPAEATRIHGITTRQARELGREPAQVVWEILSLLGSRPEGTPIVAYNARFDFTILAREAARYGFGMLEDFWVVDPLVIDKHLDRFRKGSRKLEAVCKHHRATLDTAHDAGADALAAGRLAWVMAKRAQVVRRAGEGTQLQSEWDRIRHDARALHAAQRRWAAEQAQSLEEHFRRKGKPESVPREWPLVPAPSVAVAD